MEAIRIVLKPKKWISEKNIEDASLSLNLNLTLKDKLSSLEDNTHWHFKNGKQKGVLEITCFKKTGEIIFSVHQNRNGGWEKGIIKLITASLAE